MIELFPSSGSHTHLAPYRSEFDWSKVFWGTKTWQCLVHPSFIRYNLEFQGVSHLHFPALNSSSPMFQDPRDKSPFNLKRCPSKFHNQH